MTNQTYSSGLQSTSNLFQAKASNFPEKLLSQKLEKHMDIIATYL